MEQNPHPLCEALQTRKSVAARLAISIRSLIRMEKHGLIRAIRLGRGTVRYNPADVERLMLPVTQRAPYDRQPSKPVGPLIQSGAQQATEAAWKAESTSRKPPTKHAARETRAKSIPTTDTERKERGSTVLKGTSTTSQEPQPLKHHD
jgi:hypothetical protein